MNEDLISVSSNWRFTVSCRVTHPTLDAKSICDALGRVPTRSWTVGERRKTPKGKELAGFNKESYCVFQLGSSPTSDLERFLREANEQLRSKSRFLKDLVRSGGSIEYFVGVFGGDNIGIVFAPDLLRELSDLGIALSLDIYPGPDKTASA